jgi:hypothetical protein
MGFFDFGLWIRLKKDLTPVLMVSSLVIAGVRADLIRLLVSNSDSPAYFAVLIMASVWASFVLMWADTIFISELDEEGDQKEH